MSSYFDEHNCDNHDSHGEAIDLLALARIFLQEQGIVDLDLDSMGDLKGPPASKHIVKDLPRKKFKNNQEGKNTCQCPVCLEHAKGNDVFIELPCHHDFHQDCILPWLNNTNSCPVCRHELPTDNPMYEEIRLQKTREQDRLHRVQALHTGMFG